MPSPPRLFSLHVLFSSRFWRLIILAALTATFAMEAHANRAPPENIRPPVPAPIVQSTGVDLSVEIVQEKKPGKLIILEIPRAELDRIIAAYPQVKKGSRAAAGQDGSAMRTVIAGLAMSIALMLGGVTFFRQRQNGASGGKGLLIILVGAGVTLGAFAMSTNADLIVPGQNRKNVRPQPKPITKKKAASGHVSIKIIVSEKGQSTKLRLADTQAIDLLTKLNKSDIDKR